MFDITPEIILERASLATYNNGKEYYRNRRIKSVQFNQEKLSFSATVQGTHLYEVHLEFDSSGKLGNSVCTCPAYEEHWGLCKHIVAVLQLIDEKDRQGFFRELRFRQAARHIFSFFHSRQSIMKTPVRLECTLELVKGDSVSRSGYAALSLRLGAEKLYVVRDIKKLMGSLERNEEITLGKKFTFDPSKHEFEEADQPLIGLIREIYETEKLLDGVSGGYSRTNLFRDRQVCLIDSALKRFLEIFAGRPFNAEIHGNLHDDIRIVREDIPVEFQLTKEGSDLLLNISLEGALVPLTADGEYFYAGGSIHRISPEQQENLKPFYLAMMYQKGRKLRFIEEDKERFVSEILPFAEKAGKLTVSEQVQSMIEKLPLEAEVYLDRAGNDITAEVRFSYGDRTINPFTPQVKTLADSEKLLIRNVEREEAVLDILASADFKVKDGKVHLSGEDAIYEFVFEKIPRLQAYASVFYSESFKSMGLRSSLAFSARLRLNTDTDMLEFSFNAEGIERSELADIIRSLMARKKYYQLKNGSFLNLNSREFRQFAGFMEHIDLGRDALQQEFIQIPKYRALYLDQDIRDSGIHTIERNHAFKEFVQNVREPEDMDFVIPANLKGSLRDYQRFGYKWLRTLDHYGMGGVLADDMGLGKTIQVIALLLAAKNEKGTCPSLIVVPTSLVFNWGAELDKFALELKYIAIAGSRDERRQLVEDLSQYDVVITSYPLIRRDIEHYTQTRFRYCILDEAQHIKNPDSVNARSVKQIQADRRFALTGTPMENNLTELWSIFDFVLPGYLYSHYKFAEKFEAPAAGEEGQEALKELGRLIRPFILRRLKSEVLEELPEKIEHVLLADLAEEQKKVYLALLQQIRGEIEEEIQENGFERSQIKILAALTRLRQVCCHPGLFMDDYAGESGKLQLLEEIIQESVEGGHRMLLFSQFTGMLQLIRSRLTADGISYLYLDGSTPARERGTLVNRFNQGDEKVFLISLKAGGTGLNLTGADTVVHYDPWWNPAVEDQATDRSYRIGQKKSVHVMKLVAKGTIEEKILKLQDKKRELIDAVIQPGETLLTKMTQEEIRALFE